MDRGKKEEALKPMEGMNKRKKTEDTSDGQKKENAIKRGRKRLQEENRLRKMKMDAAAGASAGEEEEEEKETKEDTDELEEIVEGTETEYSTTDETVVSTSEEEEFEVLCNYETVLLSPTESSTNKPKTVLFPKESSMGNPTGMKKNKQVSEDEDEEKKLISDSLSDDALSDATGKFPTSPIDKDEAMRRSLPGDHGL